jgi:hypothetical protein
MRLVNDHIYRTKEFIYSDEDEQKEHEKQLKEDGYKNKYPGFNGFKIFDKETCIAATYTKVLETDIETLDDINKQYKTVFEKLSED